jgi:hypothetical protein
MNTLQEIKALAKERGYEFVRMGGDQGYVGRVHGISYEDTDPQRVLDELDAIAEIATSEWYNLEDDGPEGEAVVTAQGFGAPFVDDCIAGALAKAKEAVLAAQTPEVRFAPKGRRVRLPAATEPPFEIEAEPQPIEAPQSIEAPAEEPVLHEIDTLDEGDSFAKPNGLTLDSLIPIQDLVLFLDRLITHLQEQRTTLLASLEQNPVTKRPRGRGRPRKNG